MKLYLIGLPGSGKSFLGKQLADELRLPFIDLDKVIEAESGSSVAAIFAEKGEHYFRNLEAVALRNQSKQPAFVMACGGGTPCFHDNLDFMNEAGESIFMNTPVEEIVDRLDESQQQRRPLLKGHDNLENTLTDLLERRLAFYKQASMIVQPPVSVEAIVRQLNTKS